MAPTPRVASRTSILPSLRSPALAPVTWRWRTSTSATPVDSHRQSLHDSHDGPGVGHQEHPTHALSTGGAVPTLDLDVHAMGHSAFPLDGAGPGQDDEHGVVHSENNLSIDLPLEGVDTAAMTASTLVPDHNEAAPTRLLDAEPAGGRGRRRSTRTTPACR